MYMEGKVKEVVEKLVAGGGIHLLNDLGIYKGSLKRTFELHYGERTGEVEIDAARALLAERRQVYTLDECLELSCFLTSAHDQCVMDHPEDYSPVELWRAEQNERNSNAVDQFLNIVRKQYAQVKVGV